MELPRDLIDLLSCFNAEKCEYLIVGAHALAAHGHPRFTGDLDVYFRATPENARAIISALKKFGFSSAEFTETSLLAPKMVHYFGHPPLRVDLLNTLSGITFEEAWGKRVPIDFGGIQVFIIDVATMLKNKRASGRGKDKGDIEILEKLEKK